ncbi:MAG TPA: zf-HC2 domain-containing protein [Candidatus Angelobacter sp.]|nr:zf-HC2 domain-containing protein [Candidatus Angelobacter sp.]
MAMTCREVWREVSNYIDDSISPEARAELELHLSQCRHCTAIVDGIHNVIVLVADGRTFTLPAGFSSRLKARLNREL